MELVEVGNDVYACLQEDTGLGKSNSGLVNRAGGLVVDTFWDLPHTREMIEQYARVWSAPAGRVVNTHRNGDHCWGNQLFPNAEIIGHRLCAEEFEKESPAMMEALRQAGGGNDPAMAEMAANSHSPMLNASSGADMLLLVTSSAPLVIAPKPR